MVADPGITAAIIAALIAVAGGIFSHNQTQKREIKARHFTEKKKAYMLFTDLMFKIILSVKNGTQVAQKDLEKGMMAFKRELLIWGDQDVLQTCEKYEQIAANKPEPREILLATDELLRAMRKDLGHDDSQLKPFDLVSTCIVATDKEKLFAPNKEN